MGNELSMWIQESISLRNFHLRSGQDIFHHTFADPHGSEGKARLQVKLTQKI
jgi:hypothetical protein